MSRTAKEREARLRGQIDALQQKSAETIEAQQAELEQLRGALREQSARPARQFRGRKIEHGPLSITIKPIEKIDNREVYVEHVGDSLVILVGSAALAARDVGVGRIATRPLREVAEEDFVAPARSGEAAEAGPKPERGRVISPGLLKKLSKLLPDQVAQWANDNGYDSQELTLAIAGIDGGASALLDGVQDPRILSAFSGEPNAIIKGGDPNKPGGWQSRSEAETDAKKMGYGTYTGKGRAPKGWKDPDLQVPGPPPHDA